MKIIADQNIPFAAEAFSFMGQVVTAAGSEISADLVKDADLLLVRSVTKVNRDLLAGSSVKFAGTATIGRDHVDEEYLREAGIGFASAPGSNANSVAEWVITAMHLAAREQGTTLCGKKLAVIGVGNIGSILAEKCEKLGMKIARNDPPRAFAGEPGLFSLEEALDDADYVSFHVPLTRSGNWPTERMINDALLAKIKDGAVVINAARGKTMDEQALLAQADRFGALILDVWPEEPAVSSELLSKVRISAAHTAGYSWDGKCAGTGMILRAAAEHFGVEPSWNEEIVLAEIKTEPIRYTPEAGIAGVLLQACPILEDDQRFRKIAEKSGDEQKLYFNQLRKEYPRRYEFRRFIVTECYEEESRTVLQILGFTVL